MINRITSLIKRVARRIMNWRRDIAIIGFALFGGILWQALLETMNPANYPAINVFWAMPSFWIGALGISAILTGIIFYLRRLDKSESTKWQTLEGLMKQILDSNKLISSKLNKLDKLDKLDKIDRLIQTLEKERGKK